MTTFINRKSFVLFLILLFPLVIDCLNGLFQIKLGFETPIGILYRGCVIVYSFRFIKKSKIKDYLYLLIGAYLIHLIYSCCMGYFTTSEISSFFKIIYAAFVYIILNGLKGNLQDRVAKYSILYGVGAAIVIIYCFIFKTGISSYGDDFYGTRGLFIAINDLGLSMLLMNIMACYYFQITKKTFYFISISIISISLTLIGSMTTMLGAGVILFFLFISILAIPYSDYKASKKNKLLTLIIGGLIISFAISKIIDIIINDPYLSVKYADIGSNLTEISGRDYLIEAGNHALSSFNIFDWLWGKSALFSSMVAQQTHLGKMKGVEVDPYDLVGTYGIILTFAIIFPSLKYLIKGVKFFFRTQELYYYWFCLALGIYIGHSIYGGHAYTSPLATTYLVTLLFIRKSKLL